MYVDFDVPEVPDFRGKMSGYWVKCSFVGSPSQNYQINALATTYMRLVEASLVEYRLGASALREYWNTQTSFPLMSAMLRSIAHFESCLSDVHRAVKCYRRLRRHKARDPLSVALADRKHPKPTFASDAVAKRVRDIRHQIHHLEERIVEGRIKQGEAIALMPDGPEDPHPTEQGQTIKKIDRLAIGGSEIRFTELADWLQEMATIAGEIAEFQPDRNKANAP